MGAAKFSASGVYFRRKLESESAGPYAVGTSSFRVTAVDTRSEARERLGSWRRKSVRASRKTAHRYGSWALKPAVRAELKKRSIPHPLLHRFQPPGFPVGQSFRGISSPVRSSARWQVCE